MLSDINLREAQIYTPLTLKDRKNSTESGEGGGRFLTSAFKYH